MTKNEFTVECEKLGIKINENQIQGLITYKNLLLEWNTKFNLTSIVKEEEIYLKHFYDSLCLIKAVKLIDKIKLCDFGTGAGFPGIVLAIVFNNIFVDLIESNGKKAKFLNIVKETLKLENVKIIQDRIESYAKDNRELYDIVTCRAVSNLGIISELAVSTIKINGVFVPLKSNVDDELFRYNKEICKLGYKLEEVVEYSLPIENSRRTIPILKKVKQTEFKYPRNYNLIISKYK